MIITSVAELIRLARSGRSQQEFARELGVKQSSVSRYESGRANPPVNVIEHCMRLVHATGTGSAPTANELATKVQMELVGADLGEVRLALAQLIDMLGNKNIRKPSGQTPSIKIG